MGVISGIVKKFGAGWGTVVVTAISTVLSAAITALISWLVEGYVGYVSLAYGVTVPLLVSPGFAYLNLSLVQELDATRRELLRLSHADPLTGVANRRLYSAQVEDALSHAQCGQGGLALIVMDVDNLKQVNDVHGHLAGDALLIALANACQAQCGEHDTFARIGGDEFALVLTHADVELDAQRLLCAVRDLAVNYDDVVLHTSVSMGTSRFAPTDVNAHRMLRRADEAMYVVKRNGGDDVQHG